MPDLRQAVREAHARQIRAAVECAVANRHNPLRDRHNTDLREIFECIVPNRNDRIAVQRSRNRQRRCISGKACNGRIAVVIRRILVNLDRLSRRIQTPSAAAAAPAAAPVFREAGCKVAKVMATTAAGDFLSVFIVMHNSNRAVILVPRAYLILKLLTDAKQLNTRCRPVIRIKVCRKVHTLFREFFIIVRHVLQKAFGACLRVHIGL